MAVGINRVIEKPKRRPMLAAVQRTHVSAILRAMNAQRIGMSRIRVTQFAFLQIREQVKGGSKERDLTIIFRRLLCAGLALGHLVSADAQQIYSDLEASRIPFSKCSDCWLICRQPARGTILPITQR